MKMLGNQCRVCGHSNLVALDFHHLDPVRKSFKMSGAQISNRSWTAIVKEALKCILLCANCHREEHDRLRKKLNRRAEKDKPDESEIPTTDTPLPD